MYITQFPGCCTGRVLYNFYEEECGQTSGQEFEPTAVLREELVLKAMETFKEKLNFFKRQGLAIVFACTTDKQTNTEEALTRLGFYTSDPIEKRTHSTTKVTGWFMPLNEWGAFS